MTETLSPPTTAINTCSGFEHHVYPAVGHRPLVPIGKSEPPAFVTGMD